MNGGVNLLTYISAIAEGFSSFCLKSCSKTTFGLVQLQHKEAANSFAMMEQGTQIFGSNIARNSQCQSTHVSWHQVKDIENRWNIHHFG